MAAADATADQTSPQTPAAAELVAAERSLAPKVAVLAVIAGVAPILSLVVAQALLKGTSPEQPQILGNLIFASSNRTALIVASSVQALWPLAALGVLLFMIQAILGRGGQIPKITKPLTVAGAVLTSFGSIGYAVVISLAAANFVNNSGITYEQARDVTGGTLFLAVQLSSVLGPLLLAFSLVMTSIHSMRVGLLTRFMGYLGVVAAVLPFIPIGPLRQLSQAPVIPLFWFIALAVLISGRWPGSGAPKAWLDGEAHPWPSAAEAREKAELERDGSSNGKA
jgi:hypothetical protein